MAVHMRNGIQYGGIPNGTVKGTTPSTVPTTVKQLNQIGTVGDIAPVTIPSAVKFSNGNTLETAIGSVATIETSPAVATHAVGDYVFYNGQMYKVIAAIAVGETLTVDTNIEATSVGEELTALNNGLKPIDISDQFTLSTVGGIQGSIRAWYVPALKKVYGSIGAYSDGTAISTSTAFAQIAEQYRPLKIENFPAAIQRTNSALNMYMGQVTPAGYIYQLLSSTGMSIYMNFEYYL